MALVTKSVGTTARDYSTKQAAEDALPADITAAGTDEQWLFELYNDSEFTGSLLVSGTTTDATHWVHFTAAAGESFIDDAGAATNPLKYDQSNGVGISNNTAYTVGVQITTDYVTISRLQIKKQNAAGGSYALRTSGTGTTNFLLDKCIVHQDDGQEAVLMHGSTSVAVNCLIITTITNQGGVFLVSGATVANCTIVSPSDVTNTSTGGVTLYSNNVAINSCSFGFGTDWSALGWDGTNSKYNASDSTGNPGGNSQDSLTYANQFENTTTASHDFRLKSGSDLEANGTPDSGNTNDVDIIDQSRSLSAPDIGCWEFQGAAPSGNPWYYYAQQ